VDQQHLKFQTDLESLPEQMTPLEMGPELYVYGNLNLTALHTAGSVLSINLYI
jgi:hypothetical protein